MTSLQAAPRDTEAVRVFAMVPAVLKAELEALARDNDRSFAAELRTALRHHIISSRRDGSPAAA